MCNYVSATLVSSRLLGDRRGRHFLTGQTQPPWSPHASDSRPGTRADGRCSCAAGNARRGGGRARPTAMTPTPRVGRSGGGRRPPCASARLSADARAAQGHPVRRGAPPTGGTGGGAGGDGGRAAGAGETDPARPPRATVQRARRGPTAVRHAMGRPRVVRVRPRRSVQRGWPPWGPTPAVRRSGGAPTRAPVRSAPPP